MLIYWKKFTCINTPGHIKKDKEDWVCQFGKAIYNLHQSGRQWFYELNNILLDIGYLKLNMSNSVYYKDDNTFLLICVDDIIIFRDGQYTSKKEYYIQYTDTHRFLLKIYNIHILWEFWKICNIQYTLVSKSIFNILWEYTLKN